MTLQITDSLTDWAPKTLSVPDFLALQLARWGRPDFNACEFMTHDTVVRPYTDRDLYLDHPPTPAEIARERQLCHDSLCLIFGTSLTSGSGDDFDPHLHLRFAHRHGYVPAKAMHKISIRAYVTRYSIRMGDIPLLLRYFEQDAFWDMAPYAARQKLAVPGGCKGQGGDHRVLELEPGTRPEDCLAQYLTGQEERLGGFEQATSQQPKGCFDGEVPEDWEAMVPRLVEAGFVDPYVVGRRPNSITFRAPANLGSPCPCGCGCVHDSHNWWCSLGRGGELKVKSYSTGCRMKSIGGTMSLFQRDVEIIPVHRSPDTYFCDALKNMGFDAPPAPGIDHNNIPCQIISQHLDECLACSKRHGGGVYEIKTLVESCWTFRNSHAACDERLLNGAPGDFKEWNSNLQGIFMSPVSDVDYVELFVREHPGEYVSDRVQLYRFDGVRWAPVSDGQVVTTMQNWLRGIFTGLTRMLAIEINRSHRSDDKFYSKMIATTAKIVSHLKVESAATTHLKTLKRLVGNDELDKRMDKDAYLLGTTNGLIDLRTCTFRLARPDDMVSMSVGYDWPDTWDPAVEAHMLKCLTQIYPREEELEIFGRFAGYSLLGMHSEKFLLVLTDRRNGYNAKSSILRLLHATMGEYAVKGDPALFYKQDRTKNVNEHSAGLMVYKKKRLMYCEELDNTKHLDHGLIKDICGSNGLQTGRGMYQANVEEFEWITKVALAFNQGCMPRMNPDDTAAMERLLCVPHRSRFVMGEVPDEPYTYAADPNFKASFNMWRPYFLRWCLRGLKRYHQKGFTALPDGCLAFKQELVAENDVVMEFLELTVEEGEPTDFVQVRDLFNIYDTVNRSLQRDKKTKKSSKDFEQSLMRCLNNKRFKAEHHHCRSEDKKKVKARNVFLGYRKK